MTTIETRAEGPNIDPTGLKELQDIEYSFSCEMGEYYYQTSDGCNTTTACSTGTCD
jgi:hypothetical protein